MGKIAPPIVLLNNLTWGYELVGKADMDKKINGKARKTLIKSSSTEYGFSRADTVFSAIEGIRRILKSDLDETSKLIQQSPYLLDVMNRFIRAIEKG